MLLDCWFRLVVRYSIQECFQSSFSCRFPRISSNQSSPTLATNLHHPSDIDCNTCIAECSVSVEISQVAIHFLNPWFYVCGWVCMSWYGSTAWQQGPESGRFHSSGPKVWQKAVPSRSRKDLVTGEPPESLISQRGKSWWRPTVRNKVGVFKGPEISQRSLRPSIYFSSCCTRYKFDRTDIWYLLSRCWQCPLKGLKIERHVLLMTIPSLWELKKLAFIIRWFTYSFWFDMDGYDIKHHINRTYFSKPFPHNALNNIELRHALCQRKPAGRDSFQRFGAEPVMLRQLSQELGAFKNQWKSSDMMNVMKKWTQQVFFGWF